MAKVCGICQKKMGIFSSSIKVANGVICKKCLKKGGLAGIGDKEDRTVEELSNTIIDRSPMIMMFTPEKKEIEGKIKIDRRNRLFAVEDCIFFYDEIQSFSFIEKPDTGSSMVYDGRSDAAYVGAMIGKDYFGHKYSKGKRKTSLVGMTAGAAIGGAIGKSIGNMLTTKCKSMKIAIHLDNPYMHDVELVFIDESDDTRIGSDDYKDELKSAKKCIKVLAEIIDDKYKHIQQRQLAQAQPQMVVQPKERNPEEEIRLYHRLWQDGIITSEEYQAKKGKILGLDNLRV